jgi:acetyl esterase/lipase
MSNWQNALPNQLSRLMRPRIDHTTPIADVRRCYDSISAGFGDSPADMVVERAQLGQIRGEWLSVGETQPQRLLLYFHGGGYVSGSPESHRPLVARLCKAAGAVALMFDYRLGPEFPFPAGLRDAVDGYRFLIGRGFSPDSLVLAGDGAGGGLAFATLMAIRNAQLAMPAACVALSPWADMTLSGWSMIQNAKSDAVLSWELLFLSARNYLKGANPADPYASPVFGNLRDFPPIMVHAGSHEVLRDDASRLGELAAAANVPVSVEIYDGMPHLFQGSPTASEAKVSLARLGQFIRSRTTERAQSSILKNVKQSG